MMRSFNTALLDDPLFRKRTVEARLVYFTLYNHPKNHLCGLIQAGADQLAVDAGMPLSKVSDALAELVKHGLVKVDSDRDLVWVPEMRTACGHANEKILASVRKHLMSLRACELVQEVAEAFGVKLPSQTLNTRNPIQGSPPTPDRVSGPGNQLDPTPDSSLSGSGSVSGSGSGSASGTESGTAPRVPPPPSGSDGPTETPLFPYMRSTALTKPAPAPKEPSVTGPVWEAYAAAFRARHQTDPVRNATVNSQLAAFVKRVGAEDAPDIAAFYVQGPSGFYAAKMHPIGLMLTEAEKVAAEWKRGLHVNATQARRNEQAAANPFARMKCREDEEGSRE